MYFNCCGVALAAKFASVFSDVFSLSRSSRCWLAIFARFWFASNAAIYSARKRRSWIADGDTPARYSRLQRLCLSGDVQLLAFRLL